MDSIVLKPSLREELEKNAERTARSLNDLVNEAVERFLREERETKLRDEIRAYVEMHPQLKGQYLGQWVAIYEHQLVDHDVDRAPLYQRVRAKYGKSAVLIRQVEQEPDPNFSFARLGLRANNVREADRSLTHLDVTTIVTTMNYALRVG